MGGLRWATFDCFGTLVDWRHGITTGIELVAPGQGARLLEVFNRHEAQVEAETPGMRYRQVLAEALRRATAEAGVELLDDDASVLGTGIPFWPVFPDTRESLTRLRAAGWRLALLTNCDQDIIGETQRRLQVPIDAVVTAEHVGSYKPNLAHFTRFREAFRPEPGAWVHVAQSYFHDIRPAAQVGVPRVWINRLGEPDDPSICDAVLPDLRDLVATVERVAAASGARPG